MVRRYQSTDCALFIRLLQPTQTIRGINKILSLHRATRFVKFQRSKRLPAATHSSYEAKLSQRICGTKRNIRAQMGRITAAKHTALRRIESPQYALSPQTRQAPSQNAFCAPSSPHWSCGVEFRVRKILRRNSIAKWNFTAQIPLAPVNLNPYRYQNFKFCWKIPRSQKFAICFKTNFAVKFAP